MAHTNRIAQIVDRTRYEPYGGTAAGTNPTGLGFTGHVNDADTGLVYMQQRYCDPVAGRFLSVDPVTTDASTGGHFNRYTYADNDPYGKVDPDGSAPIAPRNPDPVLQKAQTVGNAVNTILRVAASKASTQQSPAPAARLPQDASAGKVADTAKTITLSKATHGEAAVHAADAIKAGQPSVLTIDRAGAGANREASIGSLDKVQGKHLDEYPPAMFKEGGAGASVRPINPRDNMSAGACVGNSCRGLPDGSKVQIKVEN